MKFAIHTSLPNLDESFVDQLASPRSSLVLALIEGFQLYALTVGGLRRTTWSTNTSTLKDREATARLRPESTAALRHCSGSNMRVLKRIANARLLTSGNAQLAYCEYCSTTDCT